MILVVAVYCTCTLRPFPCVEKYLLMLVESVFVFGIYRQRRELRLK